MSLNDSQLSEAVEYLKGNEVEDLIARMISGTSASEGSIDVANVKQTVPSTTTKKAENPTAPLVVNMKGLVSMHAAHQTSILYCAPDDETERFYPFCKALQQLFKDKGYLVEDDRDLKLHATIVNTIYAKSRKPTARRGGMSSSSAPQTQRVDRADGHGPNANAPLKIDATTILEKYKDFVWADDVLLDRVAICEMGAKKVFDSAGEEIDAAYTEVATVRLSS